MATNYAAKIPRKANGVTWEIWELRTNSRFDKLSVTLGKFGIKI